MPSFHPPEEMLMAYAAGSMSEPQALLIATHAALCPLCRDRIAELEALGGAMMEELAPASVEESALRRVLARLDEAPPRPESLSPKLAGEAGPIEAGPTDLSVPQPLRGYLSAGLADLPWRTVIPGMAEVDIETATPATRARLMQVKAGKTMPRHSHHGDELTLVLTGAYRDASGRYARGDVQVADPAVDHQPVAEAGTPCICLVVSDAPVKLTGKVSRLLNPFISYK